MECWKAAGDPLTYVINIRSTVHVCVYTVSIAVVIPSALRGPRFFTPPRVSEEAGCCKLSKVVEGRVNDRQAVARDPPLLLGVL